MSTKHAGNQKGSSDCTVRDRYIHLGIDAAQASHVYRTSDETIFCIEADGTRSYRFDVADMGHRAADDYVAHVRDVRGWERCRYAKGIIELINDRVTVEE